MTVSLRGLRIGVIVSLALNAFLIALAATLWFARHDGHGGHHGRPGLMPSPRRLLEQLDDADRPRLEKLMARHRSAMRAEIGRVLAARDAVAQALKAQPYRRADAEAAFDRLREHGDVLTQRAQDSMLDLADQLDDRGRARLAAAIAAEHREWRERARQRRAERSREPRAAAPPAAPEQSPTPDPAATTPAPPPEG